MHVLLGPVSVRDHHLVPGSTLAEQIKHINAEFVRGQPTDADRKELTELLEEMQENQSGTPQRKWIDGFSYEQISDALQEGAFIGEQIGWAHQRYQLLKEAREAPKLKDDLLNSSSGGGGGGGAHAEDAPCTFTVMVAAPQTAGTFFPVEWYHNQREPVKTTIQLIAPPASPPVRV